MKGGYLIYGGAREGVILEQSQIPEPCGVAMAGVKNGNQNNAHG